MEIKELKSAVEAILFACGEPVAVDRLAEVLETDEQTIHYVCRDLSESLTDNDRGITLVKVDDRYQLCTVDKFAPQIRAMLDIRRNTPLSTAAMETLAVIAYNEPVTRNFIERVRGVDCSGVVSSLIVKGLIEECGRLEVPGRPMLYKTTLQFLRCFGLESLENLPALPGETASGEIEGQMSIEEVIQRQKEKADLQEKEMNENMESEE